MQDEQSLVRRAQQHDKEAFARLYAALEPLDENDKPLPVDAEEVRAVVAGMGGLDNIPRRFHSQINRILNPPTVNGTPKPNKINEDVDKFFGGRR